MGTRHRTPLPPGSPLPGPARPPHLAGRVPLTAGAAWSPKKWLILRFHWRTMLETERAPDSASEDVVLADTSAPESSMGGFGPARPATRSDMGLARRLSAETWGREKRNPVSGGALELVKRPKLGGARWGGYGGCSILA